MLQENEVRIGNAVKDSTGRIGKIMSIGKNQVRVRFDFSTVKIDTNHDETGLDIEAVPLSPELLLKLGFEKDGYEDAVWYQKDFPIIGQLCTSDREHPLGNFLFDTNTDTLKIHYLHQLQNLYYSLVGSELEIVW